MAFSDKDGVIVLGDSPTTSNNITIKTPAVADGSLEIYQGVPGALGSKLFGFDSSDTDFNSKTKAAVNAAGDAPIYACRAWVNFDGTTTPPTIQASGNVSSVSRYSEGSFGANFILPMTNKNYMFTGSIRVSNAATSLSDVVEVDYFNSSTSGVAFVTGYYSNAGVPVSRNGQTTMIAVFGGVA